MTRQDYWQHKLSVYLHDPPHKCLSIKEHERWAKDIANCLGHPIAGKDQYKSADMISSGLTRAATPKYSPNENKNGAVDFTKSPFITHPLVKCKPLKLALTDRINPEEVHNALLDILSADIEKTSFQAADEERARRILFYLSFVLKKRLRTENAGGLGAAWDYLPADTRIPDHPIWQHTALTSAIASSMKQDGNGNVSLAVFAITPVQAFIAKARKLRDHWLGSVILSYLAFSAIRHLSETIGPDHLVYPSLHDQSLVESWLSRQYDFGDLLAEKDQSIKQTVEGGKSIASFPNKLVFIAPTAQAEEICQGVSEAVQKEWLRLAGIVRDFIGSEDALHNLFDYQVLDYWQYSFASIRLPKPDETEQLAKLLHKEKWQDEAETIKRFASMHGEATARIYSAAHSLIQGTLAASKQKPVKLRKPQNGEKCPLCGEHEVLHNINQPEKSSAAAYKEGIKTFWDNLRNRFNAQGSSSEIGENERLCAVCSVKRFLPRAIRKMKNELLYDLLSDVGSFPTTTGIAAYRYIEEMKTAGILPADKIAQFIDYLHDSKKDEGFDNEATPELLQIIKKGKKEGIKLTNYDSYYAVLLMDGDKMGDLINGATITASWGDVISPELLKRYQKPAFNPPNDQLRSHLDKKRILNPSLHAAVSDSLNSFARFSVAPVIAGTGGRLIYAGGDDVCAILPLDKALQAAEDIRKAYTADFVQYTDQGAKPCSTNSNLAGKLGVHLGCADGISISAAIIIAHHKQPLREVLKDAHTLLDGVAKQKAGRNALAIRLKKRSGGDRDFYCKWEAQNSFLGDETVLESFNAIADLVGDSVSRSLIYRLSSLKDAIACLNLSDAKDTEKMIKLIEYEVKHSGLLDKEQKAQSRQIAGRLAAIIITPEADQADRFNPDAAIIAGFFGKGSK